MAMFLFLATGGLAGISFGRTLRQEPFLELLSVDALPSSLVEPDLGDGYLFPNIRALLLIQ